MDETVDIVLDLSRDLDITAGLAHDLFILSGHDEEIVRKCSESCVGLGSLKIRILDERLSKIEQAVNADERKDDCEKGISTRTRSIQQFLQERKDLAERG